MNRLGRNPPPNNCAGFRRHPLALPKPVSRFWGKKSERGQATNRLQMGLSGLWTGAKSLPQPNLRYSIIYIPTSKYLIKVPPPAGFKLYKSYADADRRPRLYLSDLMSENPKFKHRLCGTFSTFGWCSEREMAFNTLLIALGYECKVFQKGIHVWSEVLVHLRSDGDKEIPVVIRVDNTFDSISYYVLKKTTGQWKNDFGKGSHVKWYNTVSRSEKELKTVRELAVPTQARKRIQNRILQFKAYTVNRLAVYKFNFFPLLASGPGLSTGR